MDRDQVTTLVQEYAEITPQEIDKFINADWHEGEEHTAWLESATDEEIADWVIAGHPDQIKKREMSRQVWVCSKCGRTVQDEPNWTRGWLIASHRDAEKQFHGEMVIRCPAHITNYALGIAVGGKSAIR